MSSIELKLDPQDRPIKGAARIARAAGIVDDDGNVDVRQAFYMLEKKYIDADKVGGMWISTLRRLRATFAGAPRDAA